MISLIAIVIIVTTSSWLFTRKIFGLRSFSDAILTWFILFFAQIILVELFLGIFGKFYFSSIFLAHLLIFILAFSFFRNKTYFFPKPDIEPFVNSNLLLFAFSVFSVFFLVKTYINLVNPPLCPDSMQQHLAFPASWIVSGNLDNPFQIFGSQPFLIPEGVETSVGSYYPINAQLFFAWLMLPLRNAFLADAGEAPFYIIGIIAVYSILRKYSVNRKIALLSGFLWVLIPNIFKQLRNGSQIDVICAVLFLLVFYSFLLFKLNFTLRNAILFGISTGLFVGTKVINLVWLAALMPLICYVLYRGMKTNKLTMNKLLGFSGAIILMIILFGGFMYIKNYFFVGNPLFPVDVKIFGETIFKGLMDNVAYKIKIAQGDGFNFMRITFKEGLGGQFIALILPATFLPVFFYKYLKAKICPLGEYMVLFVTPLLMITLYNIYIDIYVVRYIFPYITLGLLTSVIFITNLPRGDKYFVFISFISILAAVFELANGYELVVSILLALVFFITLLFYRKQVSAFYKTKMFGRFILVILLLGSLALVYLNKNYNKGEFDRYPLSFSKKESKQRDIGRGWRALNEITGNGSRVAYTGRQEFYPLYGSRLKNFVKYISVNEKEMIPYNKPDGLYRKTKDFSAWKENLRNERIEYLFIALTFARNRESEDPNKFPIEDEWAATHPDNFQLVFSNSLSRIYKVLLK